MTPVEWISAQQARLDELIADAALTYPRTWPPQDLVASAEELFDLSRAQDVCYDRPSIAVPYALFYQGRRIHDALQALHDEFVACPREPLDVVDLGVGTGATPLALGLLLLAYAETPHGPSCVTLVGLDASAFMIAFCRHLLELFIEAYPALRGRLGIHLEVNSWRNVDATSGGARRWLIGNYVFDHSERKRAEDLSAALVNITSRVNAQMVFVQGPRLHNDMHATLALAFAHIGWTHAPPAPPRAFFKGVMARCAEARRVQIGHCGQDPLWSKGETIAARFVPIQADLLQDLTPLPERIDLFLAPVRVRRDVRLTPEQETAAEPDGRPMLLVGPAGCGKSLVLTERVKRLVTDPARPSGLRVLVTAFNKNLIDQLAAWVGEVLPDFDRHAGQGAGDHDFTGPGGNLVKLMNFDKIPTRLFGIKHDGYSPTANAALMQECLDTVCAAAGLKAADHPDVLQSGFLLIEYARVFYGQRRWRSRDEYCRSPRIGRGVTPPLRDRLRALVWDVLARFEQARRDRDVKSFVGSRLDALEADAGPEPFTHVFCDEFQDLMPADFDLLYRLAADPNAIVMAGDLAQAFFVGRSYHVPRDEEMARRKIVSLTGSHRLPMRISEALKPLAKHLARKHGGRNGVSPAIVEPSRWSPPGARPIVVYAEQPTDVAGQVRAVLDSYAPPLDVLSVVVVEGDTDFTDALKASGPPIPDIKAASMKTLKGQERDCVLWAGWQPTPEPFADAAMEVVYAALTRPTALLVLMLSEVLPPLHRELLGLLDPHRLIFWTADARVAFERLKIPPGDNPSRADEDEDDALLV